MYNHEVRNKFILYNFFYLLCIFVNSKKPERGKMEKNQRGKKIDINWAI